MRQIKRLLLFFLVSVFALAQSPIENPAFPFLGFPLRLGKKLYVNAATGADSNACSTPNNPCKTIARALQRVTSGSGDIIFVGPGSYAENLVITQNYLSLVGQTGGGYGRPDIVPASGLALDVNAQGFVAYGIRFASPAANTDTVRIEGNGFVFNWCVFDGHAMQGNDKALVRLKGNATDDSKTASEGFLLNNLFRGSGGVGLLFDTGNAPGNGVGSTDNVIASNRFYANDQEDIAAADTGSGTYSLQFTNIGPGNIFQTKNKATYIDLTTSNGGAASDQTGSIFGNFFASDTMTTTIIKMVGTGFTFVGNTDTVSVVDGSALD